MNKFDEIFNNINSRLFYESIKTKENPYKIEVSFSLKQFEIFYDDIFEIKSNNFKNILNDNNILIETIEEVNFHQPVLDLFLNASFGEQITPQHILNKLNKNWIYYDSYKNEALKENNLIYVFKFDFQNDDKIFSMFSYLSPQFRKMDKNKIIKDFKMNCGQLFGFVKNLKNAIIFCLNEKYCNKQLVAHELCHYFQDIIHVTENKDVKEVDAGIPELQLSKNELIYLLNKEEFYPHIYVNMIKDFKKLYYLCYDNLSKDEFVNLLFSNIEKYQEKIMFSDLGFNYLKVMNEHSSLKMIAALKFLDYHYDEVKEKILKELLS